MDKPIAIVTLPLVLLFLFILVLSILLIFYNLVLFLKRRDLRSFGTFFEEEIFKSAVQFTVFIFVLDLFLLLIFYFYLFSMKKDIFVVNEIIALTFYFFTRNFIFSLIEEKLKKIYGFILPDIYKNILFRENIFVVFITGIVSYALYTAIKTAAG